MITFEKCLTASKCCEQDDLKQKPSAGNPASRKIRRNL